MEFTLPSQRLFHHRVDLSYFNTARKKVILGYLLGFHFRFKFKFFSFTKSENHSLEIVFLMRYTQPTLHISNDFSGPLRESQAILPLSLGVRVIKLVSFRRIIMHPPIISGQQRGVRQTSAYSKCPLFRNYY